MKKDDSGEYTFFYQRRDIVQGMRDPEGYGTTSYPLVFKKGYDARSVFHQGILSGLTQSKKIFKFLE
jgi:hypothetical protein